MTPRLALAAMLAGAAITLAACSGSPEAPVTPSSGAGAQPAATVVLRGQAEAGSPGAASPSYPVQVPAGQRLNSPEYGIQAFLWWRPELAERDMLQVKDMGFHWIKQGFGWRDIEGVKGQYDWSKTDHIVDKIVEYQGLRLLARVDSQPKWARAGCSLQGPPDDLAEYGRFLTAVATRYKGKIAAYQIWNEPNLAREWCDQAPDPARYAEMLKVAYQAIKAADPNALVISAGLSPTGTEPPQAMPDDKYLDALYHAMGGKSAGYFDLLGVHAAGYAAPPETSPEEAATNPQYGGERFFTFRRVEDLRAIMEKYGDAAKQVAVLEMGWTSDTVHPEYKWHAVTEEQKADYLVRAYDFAQKNWAPWIGIMSAIYICDPDWTPENEQYWWCVNNPDGTPRPAFEALKAMPKVQ
jgi:polysaccharide biosynthesis protein PslG